METKNKCEHCGFLFDLDEYEKRYDKDGFWYHVCPNCGREGFEEVAECLKCGDITATEILVDGFCPQCKKAIIEKFDELFTNEEKDLIFDWA